MQEDHRRRRVPDGVARLGAICGTALPIVLAISSGGDERRCVDSETSELATAFPCGPYGPGPETARTLSAATPAANAGSERSVVGSQSPAACAEKRPLGP